MSDILEFPIQRFGTKDQYNERQLTATMHALAADESYWCARAVYPRLDDLHMTLLELDRCLCHGAVVAFEVTPSRVEMRLEVNFAQGDAGAFRPVVWLDRDGRLNVADIRHGESAVEQ